MNTFTRKEKETAFGIVGFILAFGLGMLAQNQYSKNKTLKADDILKKVKKQFKQDGPVEGSWIEMTKVPWKKHSVETEVYYGGVSRKEGSETVHYEFIADAYTATIIDVYTI